MRATQRITWLLLTTGVLFHIICTADDSLSASSSTSATVFTASPTVATASKDAVQTSPTIDTKAAVSTTGTLPVAKTTAPTQAPSTAVPTPSATVTATAKPTDNTTPTQPTAANVPTNHAAASTVSSGAPVTKPDISTTVTAGPTPAKTLDSAATTASSSSSSSSSGGLAVSPSAPTTQTSNAPGVDLHGTGAPVTQQGGVQGNVGTTKSSTDAAPSGAPTTSHTTISSGTSQQAGKGGTEKMTVTVTSRQPTASKTAPPPVNTGTTLSTPTKSVDISGSRTEAPTPLTTTTTITAAQTNIFQYSLNARKEKDEKKELVEVCRQLMVNMQDGNCTLTWRHHNGKVQFDHVEINGKVKTSLATEIYEDITKAQTDNKTLIAILASCGALLIMIVILAVCASHHRKPYHENQQHLTEELHTVENGYHDNPTLEVMEVQPEMQEKKMALNGEFNDSWIVPIDNLLKEDIPDEEDTHL